MHKYLFEKIQAKSLDASFSNGTLLSSATLMQIHTTYIQKQNKSYYKSIPAFCTFDFHLHLKDFSLIEKNKDSITSKNDSIKKIQVPIWCLITMQEINKSYTKRNMQKWTGMNYQFVLKTNRNNSIWKASETVYGKHLKTAAWKHLF